MPDSGRTSLAQKVLAGFGVLSFGVGIQSAIQLVVLGVLARLLTPAEFGLVGAATVAIGVASAFGPSGIGAAIVQSVQLKPLHLRTGLGIAVLLGLLSYLAMALLAPLIAQFFRMPDLEVIVRVAALILPISAFGVVSEALMQREFRFRRLALISVISYVAGYGVIGILLALAGTGTWALVGALLGQAACKTSLLLANRREALGPITWVAAEVRQMLRFSIGLSLAKLSNQLAQQGDNLIVGRMLGAEALGVYGRAYQSSTMPAGLFSGVADTVLFPTLASVQANRDRVARGFVRALGASATVTLPVVAILTIVAPELILMVFGSQWNAVVEPFRILSATLVFRAGYKLCDSLARASGAVYRQAWRHFAYAMMVLAGSWIGQFWGLDGVAGGVLIAVLFHYLLMLQLSLSLSGACWGDIARLYFAPFLSMLIIAGTVHFGAEIARAHQVEPLLILLGAGATMTASYLLLFRCCPKALGSEAAWLADLLVARYRMARPRESVVPKQTSSE